MTRKIPSFNDFTPNALFHVDIDQMLGICEFALQDGCIDNGFKPF